MGAVLCIISIIIIALHNLLGDVYLWWAQQYLPPLKPSTAVSRSKTQHKTNHIAWQLMQLFIRKRICRDLFQEFKPSNLKCSESISVITAIKDTEVMIDCRERVSYNRLIIFLDCFFLFWGGGGPTFLFHSKNTIFILQLVCI